jgi:uncharacterized protein (TIGR02246 family)
MTRSGSAGCSVMGTLSLLAAFLSVGPPSARPADDSGPGSVVDRFVLAWNRHDMNGFANLFTADAYWVPVAEQRLEGRVNIVEDLRRAHETWAKTVPVAVSGAPVVRLLRPDVAVILCHLGYPEKDGAMSGPGNALMILTVREPNEWRIAAGQMTKPRPR